MASYSRYNDHSTTVYEDSESSPLYTSLSAPRDRTRSTSSYASLATSNSSRPLSRDRHPQSHNTSKRRPHPRASQPARDSERFQMDMAYRWWNDYLKPTSRRAGWLQFPSGQGTDWGFIPEQYTKEVPDAPSTSSNPNQDEIVKHVLHYGRRGVHYAIGWFELYQLLHRFGTKEENRQFEFHGPPLVSPELPRQVLTLRKPNVEPVVAVPAGQQRPETPERDKESEDLTQEERCNRMVMLGFWESRRACLPSLYHEKFPNGIENAVL